MRAVQYVDYIQYTGANSAAVLAFCQLDSSGTTWNIQSESGGVLTLLADTPDGPSQYPVMSGDYASRSASGSINMHGGDDFEAVYTPMPPTALSSGAALTPPIGPSAQTTVAVTLKTPMPSTSYLVTADLIGSAQLLGDLEMVGGPAIVDADTVHVTVRNTGLLALAGATVIVTAVS